MTEAATPRTTKAMMTMETATAFVVGHVMESELYQIPLLHLGKVDVGVEVRLQSLVATMSLVQNQNRIIRMRMGAVKVENRKAM